MYGMSIHQLQFNYLPDSLSRRIAPTDTRFRPDQRALENGDFKLASSEKNRLEEKQRAIRKYNEKQQILTKPNYFEEYVNPDDPNMTYYRYNGLYFEKDRKDKDWSRLSDIFGDQLPDEVQDFILKSK